jgi:vitamin K-dependent gamma-carboxylase
MTDAAARSPLAPTRTQRFLEAAFRPVDPASLAVFRILFGLTATVGALRFLLNGWVDAFFVEPAFHFKYWGFEWVRPWTGIGMHLHFAAVALLGLLVALGLFYRVAIVAFFLAFTYVELIDVTVYLNHYYLVTLLAFLLCFMPAEAAWSVDAWRRRQAGRPSARVPALCLWLLRAQIGIVYFYAGIAKLGPDWLLGAQPLNIWLNARTHFPLLGELFQEPACAYFMSWGGFLYDTTIPLWLSLRRTRLPAYVVLLGFHAMVGALFPIGMFPIIMTTAALVFFPADWPRRLATRLGAVTRALRTDRAPCHAQGEVSSQPSPLGAEAKPLAELLARGTGLRSARWQRLALGAAGVYVALQVLMPLRHRLYGGDVLWHEQGMRWSWKVMVREKNGSVDFFVHVPARGRTFEVPARRYANAMQLREMSGQPDLILQLAHHIRDAYRARGHEDVEVRVETRVSLNGRLGAPLIDPTVDLARVQDGLGPARWILPAPTSALPVLAPPPHPEDRLALHASP